MKLQSQLTGFSLTVLFGMIFLVGMANLVFILHERLLRNEIRNSLQQVCFEVGNSILKLSSLGKSPNSPEKNNSIMLGELKLQLPSNIGKRNYEILLISQTPIWVSNTSLNNDEIEKNVIYSNAKIVVKTTQPPKIEVECEIPNLPVNIQGRIENGRGNLKYYRYYSNSILHDKITTDEILIDVSSVS